jgi:hypothetical protein
MQVGCRKPEEPEHQDETPADTRLGPPVPKALAEARHSSSYPALARNTQTGRNLHHKSECDRDRAENCDRDECTGETEDNDKKAGERRAADPRYLHPGIVQGNCVRDLLGGYEAWGE